MSEESAGEKEHEATSKKRSDSREEGKVVQSKDLNTLSLTVAGLGSLVYWFGYSASHVFDYTREILGGLDTGGGEDIVVGYMEAYTAATFPVMITCSLVTLFFGVAQTKFFFSFKPMTEIDLSKFVNILPGLKNIMFSKRSFQELLMSMFKVGLIGGVMGWTIWSWMLGYMTAEPYTLFGIINGAVEVCIDLAIRLLIILIFISIADYAQKWYLNEEELKMSTQDIKDEQKNQDGDPKMKGRRMEMARKLQEGASIREVPNADVVVVNPQHFAVALKYDADTMEAPLVVAKGADGAAARIREVARKHYIPIIPQPPLARALYRQVKIGKAVPGELYQAVALVLAQVYKKRSGRRAA
jgi:flagellar biosynthetic protein FlhB